MGVFDDIPDAAPAAGAKAPGIFDDLPSGGPSAREQEIRVENLKKLMAMANPSIASEGAPVGTFTGYTNRLKDAWTSGLTRPVMAGIDTAVGEVGELFGGKPATAGERWRGAIGAEEDYAKAMEDRSKGVVGSGVSLLGSLASGGRSVGAPLGLRGEAVRAGVQGAVEGGARNAESVGGAMSGAVTGGVVGAGTSALVGGLLDRLKRVGGAVRDIGEASRGGTSQTEAAAAGQIFDRLDNAGISFGAKETPALANNINAVTSAPLPASVRGEIDELVRDINTRTANGAMSFGDVRAVQSEISRLAKHMNPDVRRVAGQMQQGVDDFLSNAHPTMPQSSVGTVSKADLDEARRLYATSKHAGKIEGIAEAAADHSSNPAKSTAAAFEGYQDKFIKNPEKFNPNTPEQRRLIDEIITTGRGDAGSTIDRWSNNLMGYGSVAGIGGVGGLLAGGDNQYVHGAGSGASGAGAAMLGLGLLGKGTSAAMRQQLARATAGKVDDLLRNIVTGSTDATNAYVPRNALALLLAKQDLARGAGKAITSNIDVER